MRAPDRWLPPALGAAALALYLSTVCPTVYLGDSGELSTAIASGGICHPPGYPLFSLLGRAALRLLPWGEAAWRIGALVALCAALCVAALYLVCRALGAAPWASASAAAAFALSRTFWDQASRVEVYSLHCLLLALALLSALRYRRTGAWGWLVGGAVAVGLGAAHHLTVLLWVPGLLVVAAPRVRHLPALLAGPPWLALYALLPLWARAEPPLNWGRVVDGPALWAHVSGRIYQSYLGPPSLAAAAVAGRVLWENLPGPLLVGALAGAFLLAGRQRPVAFGLGVAAAGSLAYNLCYGIDDIAPYWLGVVLLGHALAALALDAAARTLAARRVAAGALALALVGLGAANRGLCDRHARTVVRALALAKLEHCDPGAVLLSTGDSDNFPLFYAQQVLHVRPDVLVLSRDALRVCWRDERLDRSLWYAHWLRRQGLPVPTTHSPDIAERRRRTEDGVLIDLLDGPLKDRPLFTTFLALPASGDDDPKRLLTWVTQTRAPSPAGVVVRLDPKARALSDAEVLRRNRALWARTPLPPLGESRSDDEISPSYVGRHYLTMLEWHARLVATEDIAEAQRLRRRMLDWAPDLARDIWRQ